MAGNLSESDCREELDMNITIKIVKMFQVIPMCNVDDVRYVVQVSYRLQASSVLNPLENEPQVTTGWAVGFSLSECSGKERVPHVWETSNSDFQPAVSL